MNDRATPFTAATTIVELIGWIPVERELPDADETVLLYAPEASEPVWPGYFGDVNGEPHTIGWHYADHGDAPGVTHWAPMAHGPQS